MPGTGAEFAIRAVEFGGPSYEKAWRLREEVLRKPLGLRFDLKTRESDRRKQHCVVEFDEEVIATATVWMLEEGAAKAGSVAVNEEWRGKGVGSELMNFAARVASDLGADNLLLDARVGVLGFYRKLGFRVIGKEFEKVGIPHRRVEISLGIGAAKPGAETAKSSREPA
ncbi:MAG: GNAT family N-acetyltransferase [Verrucomicrobiota bacterium]